MKKFLCLIVAMSIFMSVAIAAVDIDFANMKDKELVRLYEDVLEEIENRNIKIKDDGGWKKKSENEMDAVKGKYVCGEDLEPGTYELEVTDAGIINLAVLTIYKSEDSEDAVQSELMNTGNKVRFKIKKGQVLDIVLDSGILRKIK